MDILVLDDLHWADAESWSFVAELLNARPAIGLLTLLCARPLVAAQIAQLHPRVTNCLRPLPPEDAAALARRLGAPPATAAAAARLAEGNPLFVEHLVAWAAETGATDGPFPTSLHEVVLARINHLERVRLARLRQRASWSAGWMRGELVAELGTLEANVGLWLDRLESGDYADRAVVADYLGRLQRIEFELFMTAAVLGTARPPRLFSALY